MPIEMENVIYCHEETGKKTLNIGDILLSMYTCIFFKKSGRLHSSPLVSMGPTTNPRLCNAALQLLLVGSRGYRRLTVELELQHPQILVSAAGPGTSPLRILRVNNT